MSEHFRVGDRVVCVRSESGRNLGKIFVILQARDVDGCEYHGKDCKSQAVIVNIAEPLPPGSPGWAGCAFKRLPKADEAFTASMRAIKPVRKTVKA